MCYVVLCYVMVWLVMEGIISEGIISEGGGYQKDNRWLMPSDRRLSNKVWVGYVVIGLWVM